jgi:hypothetical protein
MSQVSMRYVYNDVCVCVCVGGGGARSRPRDGSQVHLQRHTVKEPPGINSNDSVKL